MSLTRHSIDIKDVPVNGVNVFLPNGVSIVLAHFKESHFGFLLGFYLVEEAVRDLHEAH
jgi:hypothetical protein